MPRSLATILARSLPRTSTTRSSLSTRLQSPSRTMITSSTNTGHAVDVLLFGWADGQPAHVAKYASLYPPGSRSLVLTSKMTDFFLQSTHSIAKSPARIGPALDFLQTHGHLSENSQLSNALQPRPLVVHCFSNGGVQSLLSTLLAVQLAKQSLGQPIAALILDSTPIPRASDAIHETAILLTLSLPRWLQRVFRPILYGALLVTDVVVHRWMGVKPRLDVNCDALLAHPDLVHVPKLVLYSTGDALVRPWHVEKFLDMLTPAAGEELVEVRVVEAGDDNALDARNNKVVAYSIVNGRPTEVGKVVEARIDRTRPHGGLVSVIRFPKDSPHVQHLRMYPEEYRAAVARFIALTCH